MPSTSSPRSASIKRRAGAAALLAALLLGAAADAEAPAARGRPAVTAPPATEAYDAFYTRYLDAGALPILASSRPPEAALWIARSIVTGMLAHRPDLAAWLARSGYRVVVMATDETTIDLPEQRDWKKPAPDDPRLTRCERKHYDERIGRLTDRQYWDWRARGMGGPLTSAAAENLLGGGNDRYHGQNIFVHEFSHDVLQAIQSVDPHLYAAVDRAYRSALKQGRWKDEYASTTVDEYWAVGTQIWFNSNRLIAFDGRRLLSDEDLRSYDPALYAVLARAYGAAHHLEGDVFYRHPDRVPPGPLPRFTAEEC